MNHAPSQSDAHVTVGRWLGTYLIPRDCAAPQDLQERLDSVVAGRLAKDCASCLEQFLNTADPAVWRIRNLALNFSLQTGFSDPDEVARSWGQRLASDIHSVVDQAEQSDLVLRFPNTTAFIAQFVYDLAQSRAWEKWYYEEFEDLRGLSVSQSIRAVLLRGDLHPADVILQIASNGRLDTVLRALEEGDAHSIYDSCFNAASTLQQEEGLAKWTGIVLELWNAAPLRAGSRDENRFRDALRLLARTVSRFPVAQGDVPLKFVIDGLLELRHLLFQIRSGSSIDAMVKNLARDDFRGAVELAARAGASDPIAALTFFQERMQGDAHWGAQAVATILSDSQQEKYLTSKTISEGQSFLSSFGGIFLLGLSLQSLRFDELTNSAAAPCESREKAAAILRHLAALKCLGSMHFADTADDPALRLFSGFEDRSFRQALQSMDAGQLNLAGARKMLLETYMDHEESHDLCLFAELVSLPEGGPVFILRDLARDEWLDIEPASTAALEVSSLVQASLQRFSSVCGRGCKSLFLSESLTSLVDFSHLGHIAGRVAVLHPSDDTIQCQLAGQLGLTRERLANRINACEKHYPFFSFSHTWPDFELDLVLDCTFSLIARAALKHFARKLSGFEASSPEHLYENFLSGLSEIRRIDQRLEVRLPASPLAVILRMAGLQEQKYVPSWLKGSEVWLHPPQQ